MSKRIVSLCSDLIAGSGPLPVEELACRVREAGVTRAANPVALVRPALMQSPVLVHLPDGRFDAARRMLDGAVLTHRVHYATAGRQVLFAGPELSVLDQLLVHEGCLALPAGGAVTSSSGGFNGWCGPPDWLPSVPAGSLLAFRLRHGRLSVAALAQEPAADSPAVERLRQLLRRHLQPDDCLDPWHSAQTLARLMLRALTEVPDLLADPLPPLDEILPLGAPGWPRCGAGEAATALDDGQLVLREVPAGLLATLQRDADRLGVTASELAVLLLSAATYRSGMPCRHDAETAWVGTSLGETPSRPPEAPCGPSGLLTPSAGRDRP